MLTSPSKAGRVTQLAMLASAVATVAGCAGELSTASNRTTLYVFADYASPDVAVSINGVSLGTITKQYAGSTSCDTLAATGSAGGVFATTVSGDVHYSINWTYAAGKPDSAAFTATGEFFQYPCLLQGIEAPTADLAPSPLRGSPHGVLPGQER
ncbi:MAG: hypothetical protein ABI442_22130 [Gemmatimonadaceae bacterium]